MSKLKTIKYLLKHNKRGILVACYNHFVNTGLLNCISDELFLKITYWIHFGRKLNLKNPKSFNEKIQWLKLYDHNPNYTVMVDKCDVKQYVSDIIGEEYIVKTIAVWDNVEDIDLNILPNRFVLKCTHDSGSVIICKDKKTFDVKKAKKKLKSCFDRNLYYWGREWAYKQVRPRIIAEEFIEADENRELLDYKFMCFNGKARCSFICSDRFSGQGLHVTFFDREWNILPFERHYPMKKEGFPKPQLYMEMIELAEKLARDIPFVRVDFFEANKKIYFGELTLYPGNGMEEFSPDEWDYKLGEWIVLPSKRI